METGRVKRDLEHLIHAASELQQPEFIIGGSRSIPSHISQSSERIERKLEISIFRICVSIPDLDVSSISLYMTSVFFTLRFTGYITLLSGEKSWVPSLVPLLRPHWRRSKAAPALA